MIIIILHFLTFTSSLLRFFISRLEMLHEIMTYFISTYIPHTPCSTPCTHGIDGIHRTLTEEISRRYLLWMSDCGLRSVLLENKDFITVVTSNDHCVTFSNKR